MKLLNKIGMLRYNFALHEAKSDIFTSGDYSKPLHFSHFATWSKVCTSVIRIILSIPLLQNRNEKVLQKTCQSARALTLTTYTIEHAEKTLTLSHRYRIVGDVRGKGLMIGVEMVEDKLTKTPLRPQAMLDIWDRTKDAGVLIGEWTIVVPWSFVHPPSRHCDCPTCTFRHCNSQATSTLHQMTLCLLYDYSSDFYSGIFRGRLIVTVTFRLSQAIMIATIRPPDNYLIFYSNFYGLVTKRLNSQNVYITKRLLTHTCATQRNINHHPSISWPFAYPILWSVTSDKTPPTHGSLGILPT